MPNDLRLHLHLHGRTALLELRGDLDAASAPSLGLVLDAVAAERFELLVLDLDGVGVVDLAGLRALTAVRRRWETGPNGAVLVRRSAALDRLVDRLAGLEPANAA
jgi:anti-anti-sigma factor